MKEKLKKFPKDWSNLSDEQVFENVKHLNKNFDKYIGAEDETTVSIIGAYNIGKDVVIDLRTCALDEIKINNKIINKSKNPNLWKEVDGLRKKCVLKNPIFVKKTKVMNVLGFTMHYVVKPVVLIGSLAGGFLFGYHLGDKLTEKQNQKHAEKIKEVVKEYEQEKAKSDAVNIDSLINQHVR